MPRLMVNGIMRPPLPGGAPVAVCRGMTIVAADGRVAGTVAAVVLDGCGQDVVAILLGQVPPTDDYRLVPASLVQQVADGNVRLSWATRDIDALPRRRPPA